MFFHPEDRGEMASMIYNWPADEVFITMTIIIIFIVVMITMIIIITFIIQVDAVVVTDGSRVLGKSKEEQIICRIFSKYRRRIFFA